MIRCQSWWVLVMSWAALWRTHLCIATEGWKKKTLASCAQAAAGGGAQPVVGGEEATLVAHIEAFQCLGDEAKKQ